MSTLSTTLLRHGLWATVGRTANIFVGILQLYVLTSCLGKVQFGLYSTAYASAGFASSLALFGIDRIAQRKIGMNFAGDRSHVPRLAVQGFSIFVCTSFAVGCCFTLLLSLFGGELIAVTPVFAIAGILSIFLLRGLVVFATTIARAIDLPGPANLLGGATHGGPLVNLLFLLTVLILYASGAATWQACIAAFAASLGVSALLLAYLVFQSLDVGEGVSFRSMSFDVRNWMKACIPVGSISAVQAISSEFDTALLATMCSTEEVANYAATRRLSLIIGIPLGLANMTIISRIAQLHTAGQHRKLNQVVQIAATLAAVPSVLVALSIAVFPDFAIEAVVGQEYRDARNTLLALIPGQLTFVLSGACGIVLIQTGYARYALISNSVSALLLLTVGPVATLYGGTVGFAFTLTCTMSLSNLLNWYFARLLVKVNTHPSLAESIRFLRMRGVSADCKRANQ